MIYTDWQVLPILTITVTIHSMRLILIKLSRDLDKQDAEEMRHFHLSLTDLDDMAALFTHLLLYAVPVLSYASKYLVFSNASHSRFGFI